MRAYQQLKNIYHSIQAELWRALYGWPDTGLIIIGVTGTNGKTTTCHIIDSILAEEYGREKVGMLTTIAFHFGKEKVVNKTKMTTLPSKNVFKYLKKMKKKGVKYLILEMTSHALDQNRLHGISLTGAIILNITREHLDYHRTMEAYALAKQQILNYLIPGSVVVGKQDDERVEHILKQAEAQQFLVKRFSTQDTETVHTPLAGAVNKENVLASMLLARAIGLSEKAISSGVASVNQVAGRMEIVDSPYGFKVVIDYAVTSDALRTLYADFKQKTQGKIYGVLGAAGLRDRGKRPDMARSVAQYVDELVITTEDPWTENQEQIFADLEKGLANTAVSWRRIVDRKKALAWCINHAQSGDVIITTGKGAERGMAIGKKIIPWHERTVVEELIKNRS